MPLQLDAVIWVPLPLLETLSNVFNGNTVEGCQQFLLNLCDISKTPSFWLKTKWGLCPPFTRPCSLQLIFVPKAEAGFEGQAIC
jgi:hypothetical protein